MRELGISIWTRSHGRKEDDEEAIKWLEQAAEKGDAEAMFQRGTIAGNSPEAAEWFLKGAEAGNRASCVWLGDAYRYGRYGLPVDLQESDKWFAKAAELARHAN
jgi:TPR repeat protein